MQIIVIKQETDELISIEVPHDANAELLVQMVQSEVGIPVQELRLEVEGVPIRGGSLIAQGVVDGTAIIARREAHRHHSHPTAATSSPAGQSHSHAHSQSANHPPPAPARNQQVQLIDPSSVAPERLLEFIRENPSTLVQYKRLDPELGTLIEEGDAGKIRVLIMKRAMSRHKIVYEAKMEEIALHTADPMDPEVQKKIAERIRLAAVQENLDNAMENLPEAFGRVTMLYVPLHINNQPVKAFVDSGAQITIMSHRCAEACGITYLIDTRMTSQLRGVGTSQSLGRIHAVQMKFGNSYMAVSITVVPNNDMDFLLGLDNLKRLRGVIDLNRNVLCLDGAVVREEVAFLGESDLPDHAKGNYTEPAEDDSKNDDTNSKPSHMDTSK